MSDCWDITAASQCRTTDQCMVNQPYVSLLLKLTHYLITFGRYTSGLPDDSQSLPWVILSASLRNIKDFRSLVVTDILYPHPPTPLHLLTSVASLNQYPGALRCTEDVRQGFHIYQMRHSVSSITVQREQLEQVNLIGSVCVKTRGMHILVCA